MQTEPRPEMTGAQALAQALADAGIRAAYSFPGSPATKVSQQLARTETLRHFWCTNEAVAATMAVAGAALRGWGTACIVKHVGINVALDVLATAAQMSEYASPLLFIEGIDAQPKTSQNIQDNRPLWASHARMIALEPGTVQECYDLVRHGARLSAAAGMPIAVRAEERVLGLSGPVRRESPEPHGAPSWHQPVPFISTAATCGFHSGKREHLLETLAPTLPMALSPGKGSRGYLVAGQLGAFAATDAPTLRLGACWPLPERPIRDFIARFGLKELLVVEEGLPFLTTQVRALGLGLAVERGELWEPTPSPPLAWPPVAAPEPFSPPWATCFEQARDKMPGFPVSDARRGLFGQLRELPRRALICTDPGVTGVLGIRDRLVDLKLQMGCAAPAAGALADAGLDCLPVAVMGDTNFYHSELPGLLDNAVAGRDVLHVLVLNRKSEMTAGVRTPYLQDSGLEALLRAAGLALFGDVRAASEARGPRIVIFRTETSVQADA